MKKTFISAFFLYISCVANIYALSPVVESGNGPVKQITITIHPESNEGDLAYGNMIGETAIVVVWYDSIGRILEHADYLGQMLDEGYVCQYINDTTCIQYDYDINGLIKGFYTSIRLDTNGHQVSSERYLDGILVDRDSTEYNEFGLKVVEYETQDNIDSLIVRYIYSYDTLGRLSKVDEPLYGLTCTLEYFSNGNYTEHHSDSTGKKWDKKYFVNKKGLLIRKDDKHTKVSYSKFDKYDNWLISECLYKSDNVVVITERKIEYYE